MGVADVVGGGVIDGGGGGGGDDVEGFGEGGSIPGQSAKAIHGVSRFFLTLRPESVGAPEQPEANNKVDPIKVRRSTFIV